MVQQSIGLFIGASASGLKAITFALLVCHAPNTDPFVENKIAIVHHDVAITT